MKTRDEIYDKEYDRLENLHIKNTINIDNILVQLSVGSIVILATLGKEVLKQNKVLSYLTVILLGSTILQVVIGYFLSDIVLEVGRNKLDESYRNNKRISIGLDNNFWAKLIKWLNRVQVLTFAVGIGCLCALLFIYIGRIKNG